MTNINPNKRIPTRFGHKCIVFQGKILVYGGLSNLNNTIDNSI